MENHPQTIHRGSLEFCRAWTTIRFRNWDVSGRLASAINIYPQWMALFLGIWCHIPMIGMIQNGTQMVGWDGTYVFTRAPRFQTLGEEVPDSKRAHPVQPIMQYLARQKCDRSDQATTCMWLWTWPSDQVPNQPTQLSHTTATCWDHNPNQGVYGEVYNNPGILEWLKDAITLFLSVPIDGSQSILPRQTQEQVVLELPEYYPVCMCSWSRIKGRNKAIKGENNLYD